MSSDAPREVLLCDKCGKTVPSETFRQCRLCGGYFDQACFWFHDHESGFLDKLPKHPWVGEKGMG